MTYYQELFRRWQPKYDPRHIEAYVRLEYPSLNGCTKETLMREAKIAAACIQVHIDEGNPDQPEILAQSFGL